MACIVMELLEGEPLGSYMARKGFLGVNEVTTLLLPAMRGVAAANAQGVIHRDLKPQNIFICMEPDGRIVTTKVLDFGIAVMVERGLDPSAGPALAMGTPAYMSPEHILGVADIDGRADVYGFGLLLYESLTGQMAFPGEPSLALFDRILHKPAVPVTVVRPDLPAGLVRIIEKAMAKDRDQRYSDVNLLVRALEDELTTPTPAPRLLTPQAGVPLSTTRELPSRPHASVVQAVLNKEPPKTRSRGIGALPARRAWGGLVGAGVAVVVGFFAVSVATRAVRRVQTGAPTPIADGASPARKPVVQPAVPAVVSTATVDAVAVPAPLTVSPSPFAPSALATRESSHPVRHGRDMPVLVTPRRLLVAVRETSNELPPQQHALRRSSGRDEPAQAPHSERRAGARAKSPAPRAGPLSREDF
jgi:serine/threonine-protein kinase